MTHLPYNLEAPLCRAVLGRRYGASLWQANKLVTAGYACRVGRPKSGRVTLIPTAAGNNYVRDLAACIGADPRTVAHMYDDEKDIGGIAAGPVSR